ncbi:MAG TPA: DegT/DnrJ/EryC1/StrS aminotransferase family protein [Bacillota bacterium]|nr:DegT/DnrJ/EryC1/StrS aminotransferase family protein [Bacillota bacterium]HQE10974.1 DegT/DnrJ/EryC1/StrS aminotransferase family protein [Bacillota bacterium]
MGRNKFIFFSPPAIGDEEIEEVIDTLRSGWITTGPKTRRFEEYFKDYVGSPAALALSSCTAGLHLALAVLGIGAGDEVITSTMTFASSVNVIEHVGARPVLVDVEPDTLNLDPDLVEKKITPRTRAILPVHYAGHPAEMDKLNEIARAARLEVVEDAAHALAAGYKGRAIGSGSNPVAFSFYATKNITTAEGGMLTGSRELIKEARVLSLHGMSRDAWKRYDRGGSWYYEVLAPGYKYNMTDIQASLGLHQLRKLKRLQERRREIVRAYNAAFSGNDALEIPVEREEVEHAWHLYAMRLRTGALTIDRDAFIRELNDYKIGASVHFIPIHLHPYYRDKYSFAPVDFPVAYSNYRRLISLPLSPALSDEDVADVIEAVLEVVKRYRR